MLFCNMWMSVGTVAQQSATVLMVSSSEWVGSLMLFSPQLFIPFLPAPRSVWIQPDIATETLPLYHHSRKSTVTEYPEAPGW